MDYKRIFAQAFFEGMEPERVSCDVAGNPKEKATFNLSKAVLGELEDCWIAIRKLRGDKKISKTDIVEQAIEEAIKDFKLRKELSKFYSKLESNKAINGVFISRVWLFFVFDPTAPLHPV